MKILLVLPAGANVRVTHEHPAVPRRSMLRFSVLPLTTVAALTPPEDEVRIVDENVEPLDLRTPADVVGITFMTALAPRAYAIAQAFRRQGSITIAGGYHPTLCPEDVAPHFDAVVIGDAEEAWPQVLEDVRRGSPRKIYRGATAPVITPPIPRRELRQHVARHYATTHAVQTSRGCPHACSFCSVTAFHHGALRHRPIADVIRELQTLPRGFIFVDDNICADRAYAHRLFTTMRPLHQHWVSQCSLEVADDPGLLGLMRSAGCRGLFIGLESLSAQNLADVNKTFNACDRYQERIRAIRRQGIGVIAGIIVGLDDDDPGVFARVQDFARVSQLDAVQVNILTPLPGTRLFADMEAAGRIRDRDWSHYDFRHVVFHPLRLREDELQAGADWLYAQFYRLDRILRRFVRAVFTIGWRPAVWALRLGLTYRFDNRREGIVGRLPVVRPHPVGNQAARPEPHPRSGIPSIAEPSQYPSLEEFEDDTHVTLPSRGWRTAPPRQPEHSLGRPSPDPADAHRTGAVARGG